MTAPYDIVMIGAGIVGLATANELTTRHPSLRVAIVEKEVQPGLHQSGHNSGVLHAGVYYAPGSLKARLCVEGKQLMTDFAEEHGITYELCGKLIVATEQSELGRLENLFERATANGVPGLKVVGPEEIAEIEPHSAGIRALHSPKTGIIDFGAVVRTLVDLLRAKGVDFFFGQQVTGIRRQGDLQVVQTPGAEFATKGVISCAGLQSDKVAAMNSDPELRIMPFRGDYYTLRPEARHLCRGLIYPVPDPDLPFLGVHFTKRFDGAVWAGPNAVLALRREGYKRTDLSIPELFETVTAPAFAKMAAKMWRSGAQEMWRDAVKPAFVKDLQRYVPAVTSGDLVFGPSGVRAQAVSRAGELVDDFAVSVAGRSVHVLNAPSPAATASLAIARLIADRASEALELTAPAASRPARARTPRKPAAAPAKAATA